MEKRKRITLAFAAILAACAVYGLLFFLKATQPVFLSGSTLSPQDSTIYLLRGATEEGDALAFDIYLGGESQSIDLLSFNAGAFDIFVDRKPLPEVAKSDTGSLLFSANISPTGKNNLHVSISGAAVTPQSAIFICNKGVAQTPIDIGDVLRLLGIGFCFSICLYSLSLHAFKKSEHYLLTLAGYALMLALWGALFYFRNSLPFNAALFSAARTFFMVSTFMLTVRVGFKLMELSLPSLALRLLRWPWVAAISLAFTLLSAFIGAETDHPAATLLHLPVAILGIAAALYAIVRGNGNHLALTVVFLLTMLIRANGSLFGFASFSDNFFYSFVGRAPIADLPCTLAYMLATNRLFASKFSEAEELNATLSDRVRERTRQLEEQQQKRHQLMTNMFHDVRSPLFGAQGCVELMEEDVLDANTGLGILKERLGFMRELIEDLFFMAKIECDQIAFNESRVDICEIARESANAHGADTEGIRVTFNGPEHAWADVDRVHVKRALDNIVLNAVNHSEKGGSVEVSLAESEGLLVLRVADHGPGMTPEEVSACFEQYYRKEKTSASASSGLGLAIAKEVIEHEQGSIAVESQPGAGTTFTVRLAGASPRRE